MYSNTNRSLIAVTGGIGSGKSIVCRILMALGYPVYDCDSRAKTLMDSSWEIKRQISENICQEAISPSGEIDRRRLAQEVFADRQLLKQLNTIVHAEVRRDIDQWFRHSESAICFVETAILRESRLDKMVSETWEVVAPSEVRIRRVMHRSSLTAEEVKSRISVQQPFRPEPGSAIRMQTIVNDGQTPILPRVLNLLDNA